MDILIYKDSSYWPQRVFSILSHQGYSVQYVLKDLDNLNSNIGLLIIPNCQNCVVLEKIINHYRYNEVPILFICDDPLLLEEKVTCSDTLTHALSTPFGEKELLSIVSLMLRLRKEVLERKEKKSKLKMMLENITEELNIAKRVQQQVLPKAIASNKIKIHASYNPSEVLSGDLYYWCEINEDEYGIILIDVSGHGVHSALVSMSMRSLFPGLLTRVKEPELIVKELNKHMYKLFEDLQPTHLLISYFTAIVIHINTRTKEIKYVNSGHPPGMLKMGNSIKSLNNGSLPIGLIDPLPIEAETIQYNDTVSIFLYTDGLIESKQKHNDKFLKKIENLFLESQLDEGDLLCENLLSMRMEHGEIDDDICLIYINIPNNGEKR